MSTVTIDLLDIVGRSAPCKVVFRPLDTPFPDAAHHLRVSASRSVYTGKDGRAAVSLTGGNYEVLVWDRDEAFLDRLTIGVPDDQATYPLAVLINGGVVPPVPPIVQGPPGSQILSETHDPLLGEGADGDYLFNTITKMLYGPKAGGIWPSVGISLQGDQGVPGTDGVDGVDGRDPEFQATASHIQWRYVGEATWNNLVALSMLKGERGNDGDDGRAVELQKSVTHIQWRYAGDSTWNNLVALSDLKGQKGDQGDPGPLNNFAHSALTGTVLDGSQDRFYYKSISSNTTFTFSSFPDGRVVVLKLATSGNVQPSWPAGIEWQGGILPLHAASSTVFYQFVKVNGVMTGFAVPVAAP